MIFVYEQSESSGLTVAQPDAEQTARAKPQAPESKVVNLSNPHPTNCTIFVLY